MTSTVVSNWGYVFGDVILTSFYKKEFWLTVLKTSGLALSLSLTLIDFEPKLLFETDF